MPSFPKWIGDAIENVLTSQYLIIEVIETEYLTPFVKRVCFKGDLSNAAFSAGYAVSFRVNDTDHRHYTPSVFDRTTGVCEIIFHLHGNGPGSTFGERLAEGDVVRMVIPRGKKMYRQSTHHILFGDETSLGLCIALKHELDRHSQWYSGIIELDYVNDSVPYQLDLALDAVDKKAYGKCVYYSNLLDATFGNTNVSRNDITCYLTGNATSIQIMRKLLKERGVSSSSIITQPYWAYGKVGL